MLQRRSRRPPRPMSARPTEDKFACSGGSLRRAGLDFLSLQFQNPTATISLAAWVPAQHLRLTWNLQVAAWSGWRSPAGMAATCCPSLHFGNGVCRNTSGEFRNFLSDVASQGFLVVAIGPAATAENTRRKRLLPKTGGHQSSRFGAIPGVIRAGDGSQPLWCGSRRPPTRSGSARRRTAVVWSQSYRRTTRSRWGRSTELQRVCARAQTH